MTGYEEILNGIRQNDSRFQMQFYDMFATTTYQSAFAILGNSSDAEEIMQDCILKALTKISLIKDDELQMRKILRRIAANAAIDVLRKRKCLFDFSENTLDCIDDENTDENIMTVENIKKGIESLALGYRTILSLHFFEDMSFNEISAKLKISQPTVRSQYSRALMKLRDYLKNNMNND
ncbi:MAG: sigma-70 family RNA polymerase sigma factor [Prevotellaceae bacterium]|jgi:RNA polymerase sigma-70 factor (ECF subfamily)|nr:sigma-70 family RNA polymerase sigma factor [Prevotellaceae bacterium]